jgi:alpha-L-fucosidase
MVQMFHTIRTKQIAILVFTISILTSNTLSAQYTIPSKMKWWYEARFGMFIHFGSYSQFGHGEWVLFNEKWSKENYQSKITANFKPDNFNAKQIVDLAKSAGMKYIVITAKHHEGFAMWKTNASSFKDYKGEKLYDLYHYLGFQRDLLQELKDECDNQGLKFCLYYSILDWNHSSQKADTANYYSKINSLTEKTEYVRQMKMQLKEIITQYHPAVLWFDGDWCKDLDPPTLSNWWNKADAVDLYNYVTSLDPNIIVNERVKRDLNLGDFSCPEQKIPLSPMPRQWETCQTMNGSWGYDSRDSNYKSVSTLIRELVQIVSRDGNYLLNIGPKADGSIPAKTAELLTEFGKWMNTYSESIYNATRSPFTNEPSWGYYTKKEGKLYIHVCQWPSSETIEIPKIKNNILSIYELSQKDNKYKYTVNESTITITIPIQTPNVNDAVIAITVDGMPNAN